MTNTELGRVLRAAKGENSYDDIAEAARRHGHKLSKSVVAKYMQGRGGVNPPDDTLRGLAAGLGLDVRALREAAGRQGGELEAYVPTARAASLTQAQRDALDQLIMTIVEDDAWLSLMERHVTEGSVDSGAAWLAINEIRHKRRDHVWRERHWVRSQVLMMALFAIVAGCPFDQMDDEQLAAGAPDGYILAARGGMPTPGGAPDEPPSGDPEGPEFGA